MLYVNHVCVYVCVCAQSQFHHDVLETDCLDLNISHTISYLWHVAIYITTLCHFLIHKLNIVPVAIMQLWIFLIKCEKIINITHLE